MSTLQFIAHSLQSSSKLSVQETFNERLKDVSEKVAHFGIYIPPPLNALQKTKILQIVLGPAYIAFLLEDGRVCRVAYSLHPERTDNIKVDNQCGNVKISMMGNTSAATTAATTLGSTASSVRKGRKTAATAGSGNTIVGGAAAVVAERSDVNIALQAASSQRHRILQSSFFAGSRGRGLLRDLRRSGVILGRAMIQASDVPESLIAQCQAVLQGKSRGLIIRELQHTHLDVNMAVNNLLSRDDEGDEAEEWEDDADDLMSLLDTTNSAGESASVVLETDNIFPDDVYGYSFRRRQQQQPQQPSSQSILHLPHHHQVDQQLLSAHGVDHNSSDSAFNAFQVMDRATESVAAAAAWPDSVSVCAAVPGSAASLNERGHGPKRRRLEPFQYRQSGSTEGAFDLSSVIDSHPTKSKPNNNTAAADAANYYSPFSFGEDLVYWIERDGSISKFVAIAALHSELIGISESGVLHQWKWREETPYTHPVSINIHHPRTFALALEKERILGVSACIIRASLFTESGRVATFMDESVAAVTHRLEHPAQLQSEFINDKIQSLFTAPHITVALCESNTLYWWGVLPCNQRKKKAMDCALNKNNKQNKSANTNNYNNEIHPGVFVCMKNAPVFHAGAIAFTVHEGEPKIGVLLEDAWSLTDCCRFKIKSVSHFDKEQGRGYISGVGIDNSASFPVGKSAMCSNLGGSHDVTKSKTATGDDKLDMPPPPSPASSTCSDQSGPVLVSPGPYKRKSQQNTFRGEQRKKEKEEESWCLSDVVFVEDGRSQPVGKVLKVDGSIVAVKFLKERETSHLQCLTLMSSTSNSSLSSVSSSSAVTAASAAVASLGFSTQQLAAAAAVASLAENCAASDNAALLLDEPSNVLQDCRLLRKDELIVVKGNASPRIPDFCQKMPKKIHLAAVGGGPAENLQPLAVAVENTQIHLLMHNSLKMTYQVHNLNGKLLESCRFLTSTPAFLGRNPRAINLLNCAAEQPLLVRDGNSTLYPLNKAGKDTVAHPHWLNLPPIRCAAMMQTMLNKTRFYLCVLALDTVPLSAHMARCDLERVRDILKTIEDESNVSSKERSIKAILQERCDGNRNVVHLAVSMCAPNSNKENADADFGTLSQATTKAWSNSNESSSGGSGIVRSHTTSTSTSSSIADTFFRPRRSGQLAVASSTSTQIAAAAAQDQAEDLSTQTQSGGMQAGSGNLLDERSNWVLPPTRMDETERRSNALQILNLLCSAVSFRPHLNQLLSGRNADGHTPFMQAIAVRAYATASKLLVVIKELAMLPSNSVQQVDHELFMSMIFPTGSNADDCPLHMVCYNDTCSFTWTGPTHINQDIFECRTCGLMDSLCCCTECARVCHKGHDCRLKRTSPTAYCDCWEKCKCRSLIAGSQHNRFDLLNRLLTETKLVHLPNKRGEHLLLHLVRTVGRQMQEQKQYRPHRSRVLMRSQMKNFEGTALPDNDLEPPKFARKALERLLNEWAAVECMLMTGTHDETTRSRVGLDEQEVHLQYQSGSAHLDQFVFILITKCCTSSTDMVDTLLTTIIREMQIGNKERALLAAGRLVRAVGRVFVILSLNMSPLVTKKRAASYANSYQPTQICKRIFLGLITVALTELPRLLDGLLAPVRLGMVRPTSGFTLSSNYNDAVLGSEELFMLDPLTTLMNNVGSTSDQNAGAGTTDGGQDEDTDPAENISRRRTMLFRDRGVGGSIPRLEPVQEDDDNDIGSVGGQEEVDSYGGMSSYMADAPVVSDQEDVDMIQESDSDSDTSLHSQPLDDSASAQRSQLIATSVSDAARASLLSMPYFSDAYEDGSESDSQHNDDVMSQGDGDDSLSLVDDMEYLSEPEHSSSTNIVPTSMREHSNNGLSVTGSSANVISGLTATSQRPNETPPGLGWAMRSSRDAPPTTSGSSTSMVEGGSGISSTANNTNPAIIYLEASNRMRDSARLQVLNSSVAGGAPLESSHVASSGSMPVGVSSMQSTSVVLSRGFALLLRQIADLLPMLSSYNMYAPHLPRVLVISVEEKAQLQCNVESSLTATWRWLAAVMDSLEAQLKFGSSLSSLIESRNTNANGISQGGVVSMSQTVQPSSTTSRSPPPAYSARLRQREASGGEVALGLSLAAMMRSTGLERDRNHAAERMVYARRNHDAEQSANRRDFMGYALSLMRAQTDEHGDSLPVIDMTAYRHVAYAMDAFLYFMKGGGIESQATADCCLTNAVAADDSHSLSSWPEQDEAENEMPRTAIFASTTPAATGKVNSVEDVTTATKENTWARRNHPFFQRTESTLALGCQPSDPIETALSEALPLADQPHILQPVSRRNDLFGVARSSLDCNLHTLSEKKNELLPVHLGFSSRWATMATEPLVPSVNEFTPRTFMDYATSSTVLARWHLTLEMFGRLFADDVGAEPRSTIAELSGFSVKESRFRKEMERLRNASRREIKLDVERERGALLIQTFKQLNAAFYQRQGMSGPLSCHRVKVTFKGEPGEGSGVARSFFTEFVEAVLSEDPLPNMDPIYSRPMYLSLRYSGLAARRNATRTTESNVPPPASAQQTSGSLFSQFWPAYRRSMAHTMSYGAPPFLVMESSETRGSVPTANTSVNSGGGSVLGLSPSASPSKRQLGERLFAKVQLLHPSHAAKITGMLLELPSSVVMLMLRNVELLRQRADEARAIIDEYEGRESRGISVAPSASLPLQSTASESDASVNAVLVSVPPAVSLESEPLSPLESGGLSSLPPSLPCASTATASNEAINCAATGPPEEEDLSPLFWQAGKRGFYSPRVSRGSLTRWYAYRNVGRVLGLCLLQNEICPLSFNRHVLKYILGRNIHWHDMAFFDPSMYEGLRQLLMYAEAGEQAAAAELIAGFDMNFCIELGLDEGNSMVDLIPGGRDISVTVDNVYEYVLRHCEYRMVKAVRESLEQIKQGVFDVLPRNALDDLTAEDLRLLLNGVGEIDVQVLLSYTSFNDESGETPDKILRFKRWFWQVVERMSHLERQELIYFWTSSSALPSSEQGFQPMPSVTVRPAEDHHLPTANTCISRLYIPLYSSKQVLRSKLMQAVKTKGFGFV